MQFHIWALLSLLTLTIASPLPTTSLSPVNPLNKDDLSALDDLSKRQTPLNIFLGLLLDYLPAINGPIEAVSGILTSFEQLLAFLTQQKTTYNELDGACKEFTVLFARGTTEPGNVGILVGPPFFEALREKVGSRRLAIQGVNGYDADVEGYLDGGDAGGITMIASQITAAKAKCPNTKLIVSGYSQGGQIIHKAAAQLPAATAAWISKVVIFGDPYSKKPVANVDPAKVKIFCHAGDLICQNNGALVFPPHLTYAIDAPAGAAFATT